MKVFYIILLLCMSFQASLQGQVDDKLVVQDVVATMFEGMRLGDSLMVSKLFTREAEFFSAFINKEGKSDLQVGSVRKWLDAIGTPHDKVWNEEWWEPAINVDGNFAHVWTPYAFYIDDTFSHCGVDSFHLIKDDTGKWKVFHATDTRRRSGCETFIPEEIKAKHVKN